jgi:hypothetical protein
MLVNRRTFIAHKPHVEEAVALLAEYRDLLKSVDSGAVMRVYAIEIGTFGTIACEYEVESLSAFERALADFEEHPAVKQRLPSWYERWREVTAPGGANEFWRLRD